MEGLFRGPVHIAYLMIFSALWGLSITFEMPSRQTLMVELVGKKDLVNAIALNSAMVNSTRVIGPAIGGLLLASFGAAWCFLLDAMSYLAVLYAIYVRVEACESCRCYLKTIDLTRNGLAVPEVDDLASIPSHSGLKRMVTRQSVATFSKSDQSVDDFGRPSGTSPRLRAFTYW